MEFRIGDRRIGGNNPVFIVAELSANHGGSLDTAVRTIKAMKKAGADAVKVQTYTPETMTIDVNNRCFMIDGGTPWDGRTLYELYGEASTPWEWHAQLREAAEKEGLIFFSTPFDRTSVDFLEKMGLSAYKIASFEITDIFFIEYVAAKGKPVILSTGIATQEELLDAVDACRRKGNGELAVLKCTSAYPAPLEDMNLNVIPRLRDELGLVVGLSDHSPGSIAPAAAAALGAKIIEKHFILDRSIKTPDSAFSLDATEFADMVRAVRDTEKALGAGDYIVTDKARKNRKFGRSLFAVKDIEAGETFNEANVRSIRPSDGIEPKYLGSVLGKKAKKRIARGTPLNWEMI